MAVDMDQQQSFKHFCRICKKGFRCGSALGGHMRAHGIGDETGHVDDWVDKHRRNASAGNKHMYLLPTNPNRTKSFQSCENYGKEFSSWNSFFEHGMCSSDDPASLVSSPPRWEKDMDGSEGRGCGKWCKRKRTKRVKMDCKVKEEEELANCLVMLSKGVRKRMFECNGCRKVFSSHQALGGHRASHKRVKGCSATKLEQSLAEEDVITHANQSTPYSTQLNQDFSIIPTKEFKCSICHRNFASGQALGGHKRCHWFNTWNSSDDQQLHQRPTFNKFELLDLNLPAPVDDKSFGVQQDNHSSLHDLDKLPTGIYLQQWIGKHTNAIQNKEESSSKNSSSSSSLHLDDGVDSRIKLTKLSDLKDINLSGDSSPWLQMGIGSAANSTMTH